MKEITIWLRLILKLKDALTKSNYEVLVVQVVTASNSSYENCMLSAFEISGSFTRTTHETSVAAAPYDIDDAHSKVAARGKVAINIETRVSFEKTS